MLSRQHGAISAIAVFVFLSVFFLLFAVRYFPTERREAPPTPAVSRGRLKAEVTSQHRVDKPISGVNDSMVAEIQRNRQKLLSEVCAKYFPSNNSVGSLISTSVNKRTGIIYCRVAKVASTTWKRTIGKGLGARGSMSNDAIVRKYLPPIRKYTGSQRQKMLRNYYKFMFVRHPFARLVSAWHNKLIEKDYTKRDAEPFQEVTRLIKKRYRKPGNRRGKPSFSEFVRYLTDPRTKRPFNRHWMPYHKLCRPCQVHYDFIGHLETMNQDARYVLTQIGMKNVPLVYMNPSRKKGSSLVVDKVASLSSDLLRNLTDVYRFDFLLFGYPMEVPERSSR